MSEIMRIISLPTTIITAYILLATSAFADSAARLSSRFLARGEQALLEIATSGTRPAELPTLPKLDNIEIQLASRGSIRAVPGRKVEYVFEFLVSSYTMGKHIIPPFEVISGGVKSLTEPIEFTIFDPNDLKWSETEAGGRKLRYASTFRVLNPTPFNGETIPVEIKLYVPQDQFVEDWGIPDFQRDGLTAWRFQPSAMRGQVNLLGEKYYSVAYPSTLTPTRAGPITIGPATVRLVTSQVILDGIQRRVAEEVNLSIPALDLQSSPLPDNAPEGFENAVGNFRLSVSSDVTDTTEGDPIAVQIVVRGSGNLDTLKPPRPITNDGWKIYEPTTDQRGDERRELNGTTVFHQFIRPLEVKSEIPSFRLVYFDPVSHSYQTATTDPIKLMMKPAVIRNTADVAVPKALPIPVERMSDILGIIDPPVTTTPRSLIPQWSGHAAALLAALALIIRALWIRFGARLRTNPAKHARLLALRDVERTLSATDTQFLMAAGRFIETTPGLAETPELKEILLERDTTCFQPEKSNARTLDRSKRTAWLRALKKSALLSGVLWLLVQDSTYAASASTARDDYDAADYSKAIADWLSTAPYNSLSADILYNIGNACYRAGSPGNAALYYRRAITRDSSHQEARQNLRFIERKYGSITIHRPDYQYALAKISLSSWQQMVTTGAWLILLVILVFPATRYGSRIRIAAIPFGLLAPLLIVLGSLGWYYFPNDSEFAPLARQGVIIKENVVVRTDASRTSPEVIDAPPGSLCEIIKQSGSWTYIAFATKTRGWILTDSVEKIIPSTSPTPPTIRKPKADHKSA